MVVELSHSLNILHINMINLALKDLDFSVVCDSVQFFFFFSFWM